jgi:two-component system LytT family response regulator
MNSLTCYMVDDEQGAIESLSSLIKLYTPGLKILGSASNISDAAGYLNENDIDILFLDIRMQNETGFDLLRKLGHSNFHLIFVTAYDEYGIQAIKFSATDYLLKPINPTELIAAVHKVQHRHANNREQLQMLLQSHEQQNNNQQKRIALADQFEIRYVPIADIVCCKAENSYTTFHITGLRNTVTVSKPIADYESLLKPYGFIRVHQSWLVNTAKMETFKKEDGGYLLMEGSISVPVSRQRRHLIKDIFSL